MAIVLAVVIFQFDNLKEKRPVSLSSQVPHVLKILEAHQCASCDTPLENCFSRLKRRLHYII